MRTHVDLLGGTDDASLTLLVRKSRSFSLYESQAILSTDEHDLTCPTRVKEFLENCKTHYITKDWMERNFFTRRLDGQRHAWVHALEESHCQYCHFVWVNEYNEAQKVACKYKYKRQNKKKIIQCLVCNVNLCNRCDHTFHGVEMASSDAYNNASLITRDYLCLYTSTTREHTVIPRCAPFMCPESVSKWRNFISCHLRLINLKRHIDFLAGGC